MKIISYFYKILNFTNIVQLYGERSVGSIVSLELWSLNARFFFKSLFIKFEITIGSTALSG
ncbi:MAG: hypothetical protein U9P70_01560, partial [Patescibacteria group bacterium]|nr:hypothetical protein [Patescibacteria group bacterium]